MATERLHNKLCYMCTPIHVGAQCGVLKCRFWQKYWHPTLNYVSWRPAPNVHTVLQDRKYILQDSKSQTEKKPAHIYISHFSLITLHDTTALCFSQQKNSSGKTTLIATKSDGRLKFILCLQGNKLPTTGNPVVQGHDNLLFLEEAMSWNLEKTQPKFSTMRTGIPIALVK